MSARKASRPAGSRNGTTMSRLIVCCCGSPASGSAAPMRTASRTWCVNIDCASEPVAASAKVAAATVRQAVLGIILRLPSVGRVEDGVAEVSFAFLLLCQNQQHAFVDEQATAGKPGLSITTKVRIPHGPDLGLLESAPFRQL